MEPGAEWYRGQQPAIPARLVDSTYQNFLPQTRNCFPWTRFCHQRPSRGEELPKEGLGTSRPPSAPGDSGEACGHSGAPDHLQLCPQIMQLLTKGNRQRTQEPTATNRTSSRSHAVLQVTVRQRSRGADLVDEVRIGRLFMVDLAGSERASQVPVSSVLPLVPPWGLPALQLRAGPCLSWSPVSPAPRAAPGREKFPQSVGGVNGCSLSMAWRMFAEGFLHGRAFLGIRNRAGCFPRPTLREPRPLGQTGVQGGNFGMCFETQGLQRLWEPREGKGAGRGISGLSLKVSIGV